MPEPIIRTEKLSVYYGRNRGVADLDLSVHPGEVYGFLGPNGAGKTTTQRVLLDIIRPTSGRAAVFGLDSRKDGVAIRSRVGYLPGELSLYPTMTARGFLDMIAAVSGGNVDPKYRAALIERLHLDPGRRMREYSRGNKQKVGVVAAFMRKPDLLILDEPTSGLDPLVQAVVLDLVREARAEGRTVFFSSHIISEVQAVCDRVGIIREGRLVATESVETLTHQQFRRLRLTFPEAPPMLVLDGVKEIDRSERSVTLEIRQNFRPVLELAAAAGVVDLETIPVSLEEVFRAFYGGHGGEHA